MTQGSIPSRNELAPEDTWDLNPLFSSTDEWEKEFRELETSSKEVLEFRGSLAAGPEPLARALHWLDAFERRFENVAVYAHLKHDENMDDPVYQRLNERVGNFSSRFSSMASFFLPELTTLPENTLEEYANHPDLAFAHMYMSEVIRLKAHVLSEAGEKLMAEASEALSASARTFSLLSDTDMSFPSVTDHDGNTIELSHSRFVPLQMGPKREVRRKVFETYYKTFRGFRNSFASTLVGNARATIFEARARGYGSALEASLDPDRVPVEVYNNLIEAVHEELGLMYRYLDIRKRMLHVDELHFWDIYASLVPEYRWEISYEEARGMVIEALAPLGPEYISIVKEGLENRWIDVYENRSKRSGGYSSGSYDSPPYILLNYQPNMNWLFTLAHEMGHSIHSYLSNRTQPHMDADYSLFVAEVASTVNEALMNRFLLDRVKGHDAEMFLVNHYLESFKGTLFRQTMFAQFERDMFAALEEDTPMTAEDLTRLYGELSRVYFGPDVILDEGITMEWARIPHFYYDFYVYKYATSMCAALAISSDILEGKEGALDRYLTFLGEGGSDHPMEILERAGVDLSTPAPIHSAMGVFAKLLDRMEKLIE